MSDFKPSDFAFEDTYIDEGGSKTLVRIVEPTALTFDGDLMLCECADGRSIAVRRSEIREMGINPFTRMPTLVTKDGIAITVPEGLDSAGARAWFERGEN